MIAFRGKLCNQAATQVRISLEGNTGKRVSIQAGSIHPALHPRNPREKKQKERKKSLDHLQGHRWEDRSTESGQWWGWQRGLTWCPGRDQTGIRRLWTSGEMDAAGWWWVKRTESERGREREAKKWLRWNWPCAKPARGFPCWCLLSWAGGGGVTGTSPLCAFWPTSLHDIFPNLTRQQRPQTKLQPVNWGVCDLTDLILLQNQEIREWFYLKLAETLKENILSSWVILVLKNFLTLDI